MNFDVEWWNWLFKFAGVFLAAGTFAAGAGLVLTERVISRRQAEQVATMTRDIADARTRQADAENRLNATVLEVEKAKVEGQKQAELLAAQQERTAIAERDLFLLRKAVEPRQIPKDRIPEVIAAFKAANPKGLIRLAALGGSQEPSEYARNIRDLLVAADWPLADRQVGEFTMGSFRGVELWVMSTKNPPDHAIPLQKALASVGIKARLTHDNFGFDNGVVVAVGYRHPNGRE